MQTISDVSTFSSSQSVLMHQTRRSDRYRTRCPKMRFLVSKLACESSTATRLMLLMTLRSMLPKTCMHGFKRLMPKMPRMLLGPHRPTSIKKQSRCDLKRGEKQPQRNEHRRWSVLGPTLLLLTMRCLGRTKRARSTSAAPTAASDDDDDNEQAHRAPRRSTCVV